MIHKMGKPLLLALLAGALWPGVSLGQMPAAPAEPEEMPLLPRPAVLIDEGRVYPPMVPYFEPGSAELAPDDPLLNRPGQRLGCFFDAAVGLVKPHIKSSISSGGLLTLPPVAGAPPSPLFLPIAPLAFTAMPVVEAGYGLGQGAGAFLMRYTTLNTAGTQLFPGFDLAGAGVLRSRLALNRVDFSYATSEFLFNPPPNLFRTEIFSAGISVADVFFDSDARGAQVLDRRMSNNFAGIGPHLLYGWSKSFAGCPLSLYGRLEATALFGKTRQHFAETAVLAGGAVASAAGTTGPQSNAVGIFSAEGGLSYVPVRLPQLRFSAGYFWQRWFFVGASDFGDAELTVQGLFLRSEFHY